MPINPFSEQPAWVPDPNDPETALRDLVIQRVQVLLKDPGVRSADGEELVPDPSSLQWSAMKWLPDGCKDDDEDGLPPHSTSMCPDCINGSWNDDYYLKVTYSFTITNAPNRGN